MPTPNPSCPGLSGASTPSALRTRILCALDEAEEKGLGPSDTTDRVLAVIAAAPPAPLPGFRARLAALEVETPLAIVGLDTLVDAKDRTLFTVDPARHLPDAEVTALARLLQEALNALAGHG